MFRVPEGHVPYGEVMGYAPGNIAAISNGNDWYLSAERHVIDGAVFGIQYQCVEFARRWMFYRKGLWLPDLSWASHIFSFQEVLDAATGEKVPCVPVKNCGPEKPVADSLLIYPSQEDFPPGHVAVIVEVGDSFVRIADQNNKFHKWEAHYSEELSLTKDEATGNWTMKDSRGRVPLGWVTFPGRENRAADAPAITVHESLREPAEAAYQLDRKTFIPKSDHSEDEKKWLDDKDPAEAKFIETFGIDANRSRLDEAEANYYEMNIPLWLACCRAGNSLHKIAVEATKKVLASDELLARFGIDAKYWPRIRKSFETQPYALTGRFDFVVDAEGKNLKSFEYNADSASTLLECAVVQQKWAEHVGVADGTFSSGSRIEELLRFAWHEAIEGGVVPKGSKVHFLVDDDNEEQYTALFVAKCAQAVGLQTELHVMFDGLEWRGGKVCDKSSGTPLKTVWKTWAWESAISDDQKAAQERPAGWKPQDGDKVRLCDVLLGDESIHVFEPMWKLIPSNKAVLPLMWEISPGHPNMLRTEWEVTPELAKSGYAKKPIVGRTGQNVEVVGPDGAKLHASEGKFGDRNMIYQELFQLPKRDDYYAILGGWMIGAMYGGTGLREDKSIITNVDSPFSAIRVRPPFKPTMVTHDNAHENPHERGQDKAPAAAHA